MNKNKTSKKLAKQASDVLRNPNSSTIQKKLAGSALSQFSTKNQTGTNMESVASDVLKSTKYNDLTKSLAGTVLSQSNKKR